MKISRPETDAAGAGGRIFRMVDGLELFALAFWIILDHDFERTAAPPCAARTFYEMLADRKFEHAGIDHAIGFGDADAFDEIAQRLGWHAAPLQAGKRRHPRIVPTGDVAFAHKLGEHALRQHGCK